MAKQTRKKIAKKIMRGFAIGVFAVIVLLLAIYYLPYLPLKNTHASTSDNFSGWAWFPTVGWTSFNNKNPELFGLYPYGTHADMETGEILDEPANFRSYAWNGNVGWIDFEPSGTIPDLEIGTDDYPYFAKLDMASGELRGWARVRCMSGDGGWVRMHPDPNDAFYGYWGVSLMTGADECTADGKIKLTGYAWSDDFGWLSFRGIANNGVEYGVAIDASPMEPSNVDAVQSEASKCSAVSVSWEYGSTGQTGFEARKKIDDGDGSWTTACSVGSDVRGCVDTGLVPGEKYKYQVKALGECDDSEWAASGQVNTVSVCAIETDSISVKGQCPSSVIVSWTAPIFASGADVSYSIFRKEVKDENGNPVSGEWLASSDGTCSVNPAPPSCTDTISGDLAGKKTYVYKIKATDSITDDSSETESGEIVPCLAAPIWIETR